jgi:hypothetical protein
MREKHTLPVIAGLLTVSAALIAGLASADMKSDRTKKSMMYAKKLDTNADGAISLDELTARQDRRFAKIDQNNNGLIDKDGFKARLVGMFTRMDQNGENMLRDDELPRQGYGKDIIISTIIVTKTLKASTDAN